MKPPLLIEKHRKGDNFPRFTQLLRNRPAGLDSDPELLTASPWLIPIRKLLGLGLTLALQEESEMRPGSTSCQERLKKKKKKKQVGATSSQAPLKSQLFWQVQSQCCHLHARPLLEFQDKGRLRRSGCEMDAYLFHRPRNRNQILFFKQEVQMIHSLVSGMFKSYCSK